MIRFPTEAANADFLGEDPPLAQKPDRQPPTSDGRQPPRRDRPEHRRARPGQLAGPPACGQDEDGRKPS